MGCVWENRVVQGHGIDYNPCFTADNHHMFLMLHTSERVWLIWSRWSPAAIPEAPDISTNCCSCVLNCLSFLIFISLWTKVFAIKYNINIWSMHKAIIWLQKTFKTGRFLRPQCWETKKSIIWSNYLKLLCFVSLNLSTKCKMPI